jgi:hypothetical protein
MKIKKTLLLLMLFLLTHISFPQTKTEIFPSKLLIQPFTANTLKPKIGFDFQTDKNQLTLNVGTSLDIIHFRKCAKSYYSFGAELFNYTRLRQEANFHFPVDAVDYLFGFTFGYKKIKKQNEYGARLRVSHISAHFVDGHYSKTQKAWRDNREPRVYSREFFELIPFYKMNNLRLYFGVTYIFSIDPTDIGKDQYQFGFDYFAKNLANENITPYFAYDFRLINIYSYTGNNSVEAGIKYGYANSKGVSVYLKYFSGYNIHGEYFNVKENYLALGFNFDL